MIFWLNLSNVMHPYLTFYVPLYILHNSQAFSQNAIATFFCETFHWSKKEVQETYLPLVRFVEDKTGGNPFYLRSLVTSLVADGSLFFDYESTSWVFSLVENHSADGIEGVDEFLTRSFSALSNDVQLVIQVS